MAKSVVSYGSYIPFLRIRREEYISALGSCGADIKEKAVMDIDEDTVTMAVEAASDALAGVDPARVGVLALASANFPYGEKFIAGTLVEALGLSGSVLTSHHGGSALAGSEAFLAALGLLDQTDREYALVIVSDAPQASPSSGLDHGFGAAACAFVLARDGSGLEFEGACSRAGEFMGLRYRTAGETGVRDIGVGAYSSMAYNETVSASLSGILEKMGRIPGHYRCLVMPQADVRADTALAKKMGFGEDQTRDGLVYNLVGDAGCCTPFLGLCRALESAGTGEKILVCTYGAGSGSHSMSFCLNGPLPASPRPVGSLLEKKRQIGYIHYLKLKRII